MTIIVRAMALGVIVAGAGHAQLPAQSSDSAVARPATSVPAAIRAAAAKSLPLRHRTQQAQTGPVNPRLMPDISAIGDLSADFSPKGSTQEDGSRFGVREIELAIGAAVDPYFRADFILGLSDAEGIAIEEAYATSTSLPWSLQARLGRYHMPFGKQNTTHRAELHTVEYPHVLQRFLGAEALKGTGIYASRVFAPLGFYQELIVTAVDRVGEAPEGLVTAEPVNKDVGGLGYSARLRNYWDVSEASNLELSASAMTGAVEQPFTSPGPVNAVRVRQSHFGGDLTYRWRPLEQGLYKSFILQTEFIRQVNQRVIDPDFGGPGRDFSGLYVFSRYQLTRRLFLGGRFDHLQDPELGGETLRAGSGYLQWFPSEFSKLVAAYERRSPSGLEAVNRILLQATFSVGPHRPHPF